MSGVSNNPQGIVVPASALQQSSIAMTTVNSQVVSGWCRGPWGHPWEEKRWPQGACRDEGQGIAQVPLEMGEGLPAEFLS